MKKFIFCVLFVLMSLSVFAQNLENRNYKLGDTGPGGGIIFYIDGTKYFECSDYLGYDFWSEAKIRCRNYRGGGYCDWRLPTKDELNLICQYIIKTGINSSNDKYKWCIWSSTSEEIIYYDDIRAYVCAYMLDNNWTIKGNNKYDSTQSIRAVRTFTIK